MFFLVIFCFSVFVVFHASRLVDIIFVVKFLFVFGRYFVFVHNFWSLF